MSIYQIGLLQITLASFIIFIVFEISNPEKSVNWIKWYYYLNKEEKGKYNPKIALSRIKKTCFITCVIGVIGFVLSLIISKSLAILAFVIIIVIFAASIIYTGPKSSRKNF
ncbi:hypothetical protein KQI36_16120 [Clostridium senegalense]|uniref:hypothetical protein n=1 Tax=Clostridium senegalense TaxID=1465809 RepID=UPI001C10C09E|nr:hypothetical protein [Clostridium senegalense]MBU5228159.1 hypothetical protein [Clostridium senegalense]